MELLRTTIRWCAALSTALLLRTAAASTPPEVLKLSPCELEHPLGVSALPAECGSLSVAENPAAPGGRHITLRIARVPAVNRRKLPDPLFVIAGGPGQAATQFYAGAEAAFSRIQRDRDIILIDQRGTGGSHALECAALDDDSALELDTVAIERATRQCADDLGKSADLRYYTTSIAVQDLDRVRAALGYERVNLYGVSYGTRVVQHYVRRFPRHARSVILDGVVAAQDALGPAMALDAENALMQIFARCVSDPACHARFGNPADDYRALRAAVGKSPVDVKLADPGTGEQKSLRFSMLQLATVLRIASYNATQAALLPLSLHLAQHEGDFQPLASQFLSISGSLDQQVAYGMHNSIVCSEDAPFYDDAKIDRAALAQTYLGASQLDGLELVCRIWPRGVMDPDFHQPLHSAVPALLLSGGADPATPAAAGIEAARGFSDSVHVILPDQGHGQLAAPCVDDIMSRFVNAGSAHGLDVSCTKEDRAFPFFISLAGPAP